MSQLNKVPLILSSQPEGGYTITSPVLPELITEGNSLEEVMENVRDALRAAIEIYQDLDKPLPANVCQNPQADPIWFDCLVTEQ